MGVEEAWVCAWSCRRGLRKEGDPWFEDGGRSGMGDSAGFREAVRSVGYKLGVGLTVL